MLKLSEEEVSRRLMADPHISGEFTQHGISIKEISRQLSYGEEQRLFLNSESELRGLIRDLALIRRTLARASGYINRTIRSALWHPADTACPG